ncbi:MAG: hypothetical protein FJY86_03140 [Candidatus Diapherotrites archaeon]|uniref:Uncharacterized protein n=1 Tax=Candidatus Iainarchaeum sp. TaxID=3101447 RepID=A0A8T4C740_9ARCH|nr:hypothetical protein [Candidatus Diapherotrites archaeon]
MPAPKRAPRMRLVGKPTPTAVRSTVAPRPKLSKKRMHPIRIPKVKDKPIYFGPSTLEKASTPLAAYALRMNRMQRRATIPLTTREMIDAERMRIRGLQTPKDVKNYLNSLERGNEKYLKPGKQKGEIIWKQDERKSIRVGKKKGEPMKQLSLTNYGKFEKLYTDPAGRKWSDMTTEHQMRMAEYVVRTMDKYHSSTKQNFPDGTYRRMKVDEVRNARIPELQKMIGRIQKQLESDMYVLNQMKKNGNDPIMATEMEKNIHGMKNRMSILQGVEHGLTNGRLATIAKQTERKRIRKKIQPPTDPATIEGGRRVIEEWSQRAREQKILPTVTETTREKWRRTPPLTQEGVREAEQQRDRYLKEKELENELDKALASRDPARMRITKLRYMGNWREESAPPRGPARAPS